MNNKPERNSMLRTLCLLICLMVPFGAYAQAADAGAAQPQRKVGAILKDIKKTETAVNKLFNQLNSSNEYDLTCYAYEQTGSKTRKRICEPQFMKNARNADAQRFMQGQRQGTDISVPQSEATLQSSMQEEMVELQRELQSVASQNEEFATLMVQLQALVAEYSVHEKARSNDPALGFLARYMQSNRRN